MAENLEDVALRLKSIIDTAIDGIITINREGIVESINKAAAKLFGYAPEEVIGHNIKMLMPAPYRAEHDGYIQKYQDTGIKRIIGIGREVRGQRKDGTIFPFRLSVGEVVLNDRLIFTGIVHDLTDVFKVKEQLIDLNNELEQRVIDRTEELNQALLKEKEFSELKSRFVSMASHEFRTPLSAILSSASLISKYPLSDQQDKRDKHINRIKTSVNHLTGILNDFLSLSKLEANKVVPASKVIDLQQLVDDVLTEARYLIKNDQQLVPNIEIGAIEIHSDPTILKNILFNLVSNALKYSRQSGKVHCNIRTDKGQLYISVADDGIGIPNSDQPHLFERFFRASNVENIQGTGLGLNIVRQYVHLLGGQIRFESEESHGTTFYIEIPLMLS